MAKSLAAVMADPREKVVFDHTVEGLFQRGLKNRVSPKMKRRLVEAGLDLDKRLLPAYPFETWSACVKIAAEECHPGVSPETAYRMLGERMIEGYWETFIGGALMGLVKLLGIRRTLQRCQQNFRSGNSYTEAKLTQIGPTCYELWMNEAGQIRSFTLGIITAGVRATGVTSAVVTIARHDTESVTYRVSWTE
jgi:uncharacterized protein (TIGR02265 family)